MTARRQGGLWIGLLAGLLLLAPGATPAAMAKAASAAPKRVVHKTYFTGVIHIHHASPRPAAKPAPKGKPKPKAKPAARRHGRARHRARRPAPRRVLGS